MLLRIAMVAVAMFFLALVARFYVPGKGFTALILFGGNFAEKYIPEIKNLPYYAEEGTYGYDAQWYVQIAIRPNLRDPEMLSAVDSLPYRVRRILFCWTAYVLGFGNPAWIVGVYACQNIVCWMALGWLMLRWFPATTWDNVFRWTAVLLSGGLCASVRYSLVDGPSLLLIACGVALFESGRPWWSALVLGVSGLGKETNILSAGTVINPRDKTLQGWLASAARGGIAVVPILLWIYYILSMHWPAEGNTGARAFDAPFVAMWQKIRFTAEGLAKGGKEAELARGSLYAIVALSTQFTFFVLRPRLSQPWWRATVGFCLLMIFLGEAVWEGYPGAAIRVLLPMTLAFNVLVPRGRGWIIVLILGNLTVLTSWDLTRPPIGDGYKLVGSADLIQQKAVSPVLRIDFPSGWNRPERGQLEHWRWARGRSEVSIYNSLKEPVYLDVEFEVNAIAPRKVSFGRESEEYWSGQVDNKKRSVHIETLIITPGENRFWWQTDREADQSANPADTRKLAFRVYDLTFEVRHSR